MGESCKVSQFIVAISDKSIEWSSALATCQLSKFSRCPALGSCALVLNGFHNIATKLCRHLHMGEELSAITVSIFIKKKALGY